MGQPAKGDSLTRWWEFYVVRYLMGTVVGGIVVFILSKADGAFAEIVIDPKQNSPANLWLLAAYGLVYCYIASAPILVLHSGRFLLNPKLSTRRVFGSVLLWVVVCVLTAGCGLLIGSVLGIEHKVAFSLAMGVFCVVFFFQAVVLVRTIKRNGELFSFYRQLSSRRTSDEGEIVESYRHLREHGNSFFIVALEILLGWMLFESGRLNGNDVAKGAAVRVILLTAWILPATFVWLISTLIESRFVND